MKNQIITVGLALICLNLLGGSPAAVPMYPPMKRAIDRREADLKKAKLQFLAAENAVQTQLLRDLDLAADQAMTDKNLEAANQAAAMKKEVDASLTKLKHLDAAKIPDDLSGDSSISGSWHVKYYGGENILTIANGIAHNTLSTSHNGKVSEEGGAVVIRWSNGYIDRLTGVGSKTLLIEDWHPADTGRFPDGLPSSYGRCDAEK